MFNKHPIPTLTFSAARNFTMDARGYAAPSQKQTCLPSHNAISIFEMTCQYFGVLVSIKVLLKEKGKEIIKWIQLQLLISHIISYRCLIIHLHDNFSMESPRVRHLRSSRRHFHPENDFWRPISESTSPKWRVGDEFRFMLEKIVDIHR